MAGIAGAAHGVASGAGHIITQHGGRPVTPVWETMLAKYGWIWIGISFGFFAKYALLIKRGVRVEWRLVLADLLLLPMVALIAYWLAAESGVQAEVRALWAAFCTVSADRLVKLLTDRFLARVDSEAASVAAGMMGRARQVAANELAAARVIDDTIEGRAPTEYAALRRPSVQPAKE